MQIQPINVQPNFKTNRGKVLCLNKYYGTKSEFIQEKLKKQLPELERLMKGKDYNLYITQNLLQGIFFNVTPGTSFRKIKNGERYRINVPYKSSDAIIAAAKEAIRIYEEETEIPMIKYAPEITDKEV